MSPMDRAKYPADWDAISRRIRERAGQRCEFCGVENGAYGERVGAEGRFEPLGEYTCMMDDDTRCIRIVLTVAHLDHDTTNNVDDNLKAAQRRMPHSALRARMEAYNDALTSASA